MAHYRTTIRSPKSAEEAFDYMSDLRNFEQWDPGVKSSELVVGESPGVGAEYDVKVAATTLRYKTLSYDRPRLTEVEAQSSVLRSYDVIEIENTPDGCDVTYDATLELSGPLKIADPLLGIFFNRIGENATKGMSIALDGTQIS